MTDFFENLLSNGELQKEIAELKAENERLKEEIEIRDNLSEKFRKEALSWANIANNYQKDKTKLERTLQEIKNVAEVCCSGIECKECPFTDDCKTDSQALGVCRIILKLISKAEEE